MTRDEHLQTIAAEECAEIAQRLSKSLRFGQFETQPGQTDDNRSRVVYETIDLLVVLQMLGIYITDAVVSEDPFKKREKVERYLEYSRAQGTLT